MHEEINNTTTTSSKSGIGMNEKMRVERIAKLIKINI